jgi:aminoglycoside 3-N-acetyltransferase I
MTLNPSSNHPRAMPPSPSATIRHLTPGDVPLLRSMTAMMGRAFGELEEYTALPPRDDYLRDLLASDGFIALVALVGDEVVAGLVAYEFRKFEQERSEFYVYDLAVAEEHRRRGIATALLGEMKRVAAARGGWVVMIQADYEDEPAVALYTKLGRREEVLHFDIAVG